MNSCCLFDGESELPYIRGAGEEVPMKRGHTIHADSFEVVLLV